MHEEAQPTDSSREISDVDQRKFERLREVDEKTSSWASTVSWVFYGEDGLRPGWGVFLLLAIYTALGYPLGLHFWWIPGEHATPPNALRAIEWQDLMLGDGLSFLCLLAATWTMSRVEGRPLKVYGFVGRRKIGRFSAGLAWGFVSLATLVGALWKAGLLVFDGRSLFGADALKYGAVWIVGFLLVGLFEEYMLRGYLQYTLSRGMGSVCEMLFDTKNGETLGFWIAALLLSFLFSFGHGSNPGESPIGLFSAGAIGAIFCFTLWKTGSLWWALGFHASWDWAQSFIFGVADSGTMVQGHLLGSHPVGKVLLSGGATGPEGSVFVLPVLVAVVGVVIWTLPKREWSIDGQPS